MLLLTEERPSWLSRNNELQFAGTYGETGVRYSLSLPAGDMEARSRQVSLNGYPESCCWCRAAACTCSQRLQSRGTMRDYDRASTVGQMPGISNGASIQCASRGISVTQTDK